MAKKKDPVKEEASMHKDLKNFEISVDAFGQIQTNMDIETIKAFLDKNMDDKKINKPRSSEEE